MSQAQQLPLEFPRAMDRRRGYLQYGDQVVLIEPEGEKILIRAGFICSTEQSHSGVDNFQKAVVWGHKPFNTCADNADDAHERSIPVCSPLLVKREEAELLKDEGVAMRWFQGIYDEKVVSAIVAELSAADLDRPTSVI